MNSPCISLIGMPGSGKSTIGQLLAQKLAFAFTDTDMLLEALYATRLQDITDAFSTETFRDMEGQMICAINASDCVIATGGSAIYRPHAIRHLKRLGKLVLLASEFEILEERVALKPDRGISFGPGQTLRDIYEERMPLYQAEADLICDSGSLNAEECAQWIAQKIKLAR